MSNKIIEGITPLRGVVGLSGAKNSAIKLMFASMFSNEDIVLENVPNVYAINGDIEIIKSIGGSAEWLGNNRLILNGSKINTYEVPYEIGSKFRTTLLLAGPLLYRFGKAKLPRVGVTTFRSSPINRLISTWENLGIKVELSETHITLTSEKVAPGNINFKTTSHMGTDNAILASLFIEGRSEIYNASEEPEIEDLIDFCTKVLGANVKRTEPRKILIEGTKIFRGGEFRVQPDKSEAIFYATAAAMTNGNVIIKKIRKEHLVQFINFLTKVGVNYEFSGDELRVWRNHEVLTPTAVTIIPSPGFVPDWQQYAVLLLTQADGTSMVHDTVYMDHFGYIVDLNRMGADIELVKPSSVGIIPVLSDDGYDFELNGEPATVAKVKGVSPLKGKKIQIMDHRLSTFYLLAALSAEGKTELVDYEAKYESFEDVLGKLENLGAKLYS